MEEKEMEQYEKAGFKKITGDELGTLTFNPFDKIGKQWALITAGDEKNWNTMTVSWGFAGVMWGKNTFTTVIRPQRYTKEFLDASEYFTVSFFKEDYRKALSFCGSHSGRDCDKASETGLTPLVIEDKSYAYGMEYAYRTTALEQADMVLVCRKAYVQEMKPECFNGGGNEAKWYPDKDYHIQYIGEIAAAYIR